jgi:glycosidase
VRTALIEGRDYTATPPLNAMSYASKIDWLQRLYPWEIQLAQLNLLNSHDTARMLSIAGGDKASVHLATLLLLAYPGAPSIYYGDEIGLEGEIDPDSRRSFPWEHPETWDQEVFAYHQQLIAIRHAHPALRIGSYHRLYADLNTYVFVRVHEGERILVAVNVADEPLTIVAPNSNFFTTEKPLTALYGTIQATISDLGLLQIELPARSGGLLIEG